MPERIRPYLGSDFAFDADDLHFMGDAFDKAKRKLVGTGLQIELSEVAKQIIALAKDGERDPDKLCDGALIKLGARP